MKKRIIILSLCLMIFGVLCVKSINKSPVDENEINHIISELFLSRAKLRLHNYEENNNLMFCDEESNLLKTN